VQASTTRWHGGSTRLGRAALLALLLTLALFLPGATAARADMEGPTDAKSLVDIATGEVAARVPLDRITEGIDAALAAPPQKGVDRAAIEEALALVKSVSATTPAADLEAAMSKTQKLLQKSIGVSAVVPKSMLAVGDETGTTVVLENFQPAFGISDGGDAALVVLALAAIVGGLYMARRLRPEHSIKELRRRSAAVKGA